MAEMGKLNKLQVVRKSPYGVYLGGGPLGEILLAARDAPARCEVGDSVEAFVYVDSDDTIVATTKRPRAMVGQFALLKVLSVSPYGAFLDWGLPKDLLVPFGEQKVRMEAGRSYLVRVYLDERSGRIVASSRLDRFLDQTEPHYQRQQEVDLVIGERTDLGYKVIVDDAHWGVLYQDEVFGRLRFGQHLRGYIKKLREDGKIDVMLHKPGYAKVDEVSAKVLERIRAAGGYLDIGEKSPPEVVHAAFGVSKKTFKLAVSALYRERLIRIEKDGLYLAD